MFGPLHGWEIAIIVLVVLIVFGVGRLPNALGAIGKGVRNFRRSAAGEDEEESPKKAKETAAEKDAAEETKS